MSIPRSSNQPICPNCRRPLASSDINIQADAAHCSGCGAIHRVSALLEDPLATELAGPLKAPPGASFERGGSGWTLTASTRSPIAFFLIPFMLVWSGFSLGGIYGAQLAAGRFDPEISLFGIPFIAGSVIFWSIALMAVAGRVEVRGKGNEGAVFTGVGPIGYTQRFRWSEIQRVSEEGTMVRYPGSHQRLIYLEGARRIAFGSGLNEERRYFVAQKLRAMLREQRG